MKHRDINEPLENWQQPPRPTIHPLLGQYVRLEPLNAERHSSDIHAANLEPGGDRNWDYMHYGPFKTAQDYHLWVQGYESTNHTRFFAVCDLETGRFVGVASYLRIAPEDGSIEVGHINFSPLLQRTKGATETMYLMMQWAFEAGYRRYEWKCNALNLPSRRAAQRLGFSFEGIFRQHMIVKARNRDTAWFATIDKEWPLLKAAFETWLAPGNFDRHGQQKQSLSILTKPILVTRDPAFL